MARSICFVLGALLVGASAHAQSTPVPRAPDVAVRLEVYEPFSPFERVVFEWKVRGNAPLLTMSRVHLAGFGGDDELTLVTVERFQALVESLDACSDPPEPTGASADVERPESGGELRWALVTVRQGASEWRALWWGGEGECERAIRGPVEAQLAFDAYRNPYWVEGEYGMLRTETNRPSRVYIDGLDTGEFTPLLDYPLEPGQHAIRWVATSGAIVRNETVTIEAGRTTTLNVALTDP